MTRVHRQSRTEKPWNSADAEETRGKKYIPVHKPDSQIDIDLCINCPLPPEKCFGNGGCYAISENCKTLSWKRSGRDGAFDLDLFIEAQDRGMPDFEVAALFKVTPRTVRYWKQKHRAEINERRGNTNGKGEKNDVALRNDNTGS